MADRAQLGPEDPIRRRAGRQAVLLWGRNRSVVLAAAEFNIAVLCFREWLSSWYHWSVPFYHLRPVRPELRRGVEDLPAASAITTLQPVPPVVELP